MGLGFVSLEVVVWGAKRGVEITLTLGKIYCLHNLQQRALVNAKSTGYSLSGRNLNSK
jgi:hypothetical protein